MKLTTKSHAMIERVAMLRALQCHESGMRTSEAERKANIGSSGCCMAESVIREEVRAFWWSRRCHYKGSKDLSKRYKEINFALRPQHNEIISFPFWMSMGSFGFVVTWRSSLAWRQRYATRPPCLATIVHCPCTHLLRNRRVLGSLHVSYMYEAIPGAKDSRQDIGILNRLAVNK